MARRTLSRGLVVAAATAAMVTTIAPLMTTAANAATVKPAATTPSETTVPATQDPEPANDVVYFAGETGYLHRAQGTTDYQWTTYADGATTEVNGYLDGPNLTHLNGVGGDTVVTVGSGADAGKFVFTDMGTGHSTGVPATPGWTVLGQFDGRVLQGSSDSGVPSVLALNDAGTAVVRTPVTGWPADDAISPKLLGGDARSAVLLVKTAVGYQLAVVDLATAATTVVPGTVDATAAVTLSGNRIAWWAAGTPADVHLIDRGDLSAAQTGVTLPAAQGPVSALRIVGDWLVTTRSPAGSYSGGSLTATPVAGGETVSLLDSVHLNTFAQGDDSVLVEGGTGESDWAVHRVTQGSDGKLAVSTVMPLPNIEKVDRLSLSGGQLLTLDQGTSQAATLHSRTVSLPLGGAHPVVGGQSTVGYPLGGSSALFGTGTDGGTYTQLQRVPGSKDVLHAPAGTATWTTMYMPTEGGSIAAADNKYTVYTGSNGTQYVYRNGRSTPLITRPAQATGLWADLMVSATGKPGGIVEHDLTTGRDYPLSTGGSCVPTDVQIVGNWFYWSCGTDGPAGVINPDHETGEAFGVPSGPSILADGYLVHHDLKRGELTFIDLTTWYDGSGTPPQPVDLAPLPAPADGQDDRGTAFTADPYGAGGIAYVDGRQRVHVLDPGVGTAGVVSVDVAQDPPATLSAGQDGWSGAWQLTGPVASVSLVIQNEQSRVIRTVPGTVEGDIVSVAWNGELADGTKAPNGTYRYLATIPSTGSNSGQPYQTTAWGTVRVVHGTDGYRDQRGVGLGTVVTMNSAGYLTTHAGTVGGGSLAGWKSGQAGWATNDVAVPFGALHGNGCADTLVRTSTGELRDYHTGCGAVLGAPSTTYASLGTGWNQYKSLQYTGDLNGDGLPDLLAWSASTGNLYMYPGTAAGKLGARVLVKADQRYVRFIAVGDVDGDGIGDLLAYDHEHNLWAMTGNGKGGFNARFLSFADWGSGYNAMVGAGDINGDGMPDLIERDSAGDVWANFGANWGHFSGRVKVATGWQGYKALY